MFDKTGAPDKIIIGEEGPSMTSEPEYQQRIIPLDRVPFLGLDDRFTVVARIQKLNAPTQVASMSRSYLELWDGTHTQKMVILLPDSSVLPTRARYGDILLARNACLVRGFVTLRPPVGCYMILNGWEEHDDEEDQLSAQEARVVSRVRWLRHLEAPAAHPTVPYVFESYMPRLLLFPPSPSNIVEPRFFSLAHVSTPGSLNELLPSCDDDGLSKRLIAMAALAWHVQGSSQLQLVLWDGSGGPAVPAICKSRLQRQILLEAIQTKPGACHLS
jgi:hypothetical protein